jgi:hypothetical protein
MDKFVAKPSLNTEIAFIDSQAIIGYDPPHVSRLCIDNNRTANGTVRTNCGRTDEFPRPAFEPQGSVLPGAGRAHGNATAAKTALQRPVKGGADDRFKTAVLEVNGAHPFDLFTGAYATSAQNTPVAVQF